MKRRIIQIDQTLCNGCGACASACHEGAIAMIDGKATLIRDDYCDGLGDCLPTCPTGAIQFVVREAAAYDEAAVQENKKRTSPACTSGCPGLPAQTLHPAETTLLDRPSQLAQWPVQIKLAPLSSPYFENADLLIAADCTAYACAAFHERFMRQKITLIGCPKLDSMDYSEKLSQILKDNSIQSVTIVRMEVPCCRGLEAAVRMALEKAGHPLPLRVAVVSIQGEILSDSAQ